jgi:hypothetical protein
MKALNCIYEDITPCKQRVFYANGHLADIIGTIHSNITLGNWTGSFNILVAHNTIRQCILGLDILLACPLTQEPIRALRKCIRQCAVNPQTQHQQEEQSQHDSIACTHAISNKKEAQQTQQLQHQQHLNNSLTDSLTERFNEETLMFHDKNNTSNSELDDTIDTDSTCSSINNEDGGRSERHVESFHVNTWAGDMEAVNQWHLGAERSQGRIEETNPFTTREQEESQSVTRVNESNHENTNDSSLKAAQQAIMDALSSVAVNSLRLLNTTTSAITHTIRIKPNTPPLKQKERRIPMKFSAEFETMIDDMLEAGKIRETFDSPWASPLCLLRKKDKSLRVTVDYGHLNKVTERIAYPFPYPEEIFSKLARARYFTVVDLTSGYYQVPLDPASRKFTAFMCSKGTFEYLVLPMGLTNATETFQKMMNTVLKGLTGKICEVYLDDIIIYSETLNEHIKHVEAVVQRLKQYNLKVKLSKCKIVQQKIQYLSHVISHCHIQPSTEKVKDLNKFQTPLNYSQIHSFIGLASYYRKFVKNFASIISPLLRAAQNKHITWTEECQNAFNAIKMSLQAEPILKLPDFTKSFSLNTDACKYGVGAVLTQTHAGQEHPVAYYSKHLTRAQRNYSTTERELLAIVLSVQHFKQFLYGGNFTVWSDHQPLKHLLSTKEPATRLLRLLNKLSTFDYEIKYKKGTANGDADALSRIPIERDDDEEQEDDAPVIINYIVASNEDLNEQQSSDDNLAWLYALKQKAASENQFKIEVNTFANREQQCYYKQWDRIHILNRKLYRTWTSTKNQQAAITFQYIVPFKERIEIMQAAHDSITSGHLGSDRTITRIAERFYWPGWENQVNQYVISCTICQQAKASHQNNRAPLQPILPSKPMELIASDLMGPFTPKSKAGNEYILIITDHFSKYVELFALRNNQAKTVAKHLVDFICRHGIPDDVLTDQGTNYQSELLDEVYRVLDIHRKRTAAYHPQTDGISERHVQHFKNGIRTYLQQDPQEWDKHLNTLIPQLNIHPFI